MTSQRKFGFVARQAKSALLMVPVLFAFPALCAVSTHAQIRVELPEMPMPRAIPDMGVIMDSALLSSGSGMSIRSSMENGIRKIEAVENGVKTYIEEGPNTLIVKVTRQYGSEDMDELMEEFPDIYMSMKDFPEETEGAEKIEVSVGITRKYEALDADDLQEKHPQVFETYKKYAQGGTGGLEIFRGSFGREMLMPEIRLPLEFRTIDPSDIRIHDDEQSEESTESSSDKDNDKDDKDT